MLSLILHRMALTVTAAVGFTLALALGGTLLAVPVVLLTVFGVAALLDAFERDSSVTVTKEATDG